MAKSRALEKLLHTFREHADNKLHAIDSSYIKVHKHGSAPKGEQKGIERNQRFSHLAKIFYICCHVPSADPSSITINSILL